MKTYTSSYKKRMDTRLRFKLIGALIALSVAGLLVFQGYWLKGLYDTLYRQLEKNIEEAMKMADYKELFWRIREIKRQSGGKSLHAAEVFFSSESRKGSFLKHGEGSVRTDPEPIGTGQKMELQIDYGEGEDVESLDSTLTDYFSTIGRIESLVQQILHAHIDTILPVVFDRYNDLLVQELENRGIETDYEVTVMCRTDSSKAWMKFHRGEVRFMDWSDPVCFEYPLLNEEELTYCLYLKSPSWLIWKQMWGILVSSFCLLVLIVLAFIYLLRTILRQKTVEELKTDFTNNMTHELKTPISVSYAAVDALLNFTHPVDEKQRSYLTIVKDQLIRLTGLVEQILTLAVENRSTFRLHPEAIPLDEVMRSLTEQHTLKAERAVEFTCSLPDNAQVTADRTHLYNMLSNLIDNAVKYCDKEICRIDLAVRLTDHAVSISVTDNGPGISEANQRRLFDKFFRVPSGNVHNVKGYGLGLYYVKDMMERHGGSVRVKSAPGKGAVFTLYFRK